MQHGSRGCCTLLFQLAMPSVAIFYSAVKQDALDLQFAHRQDANIRFLSFIGTEGSGHHLLTPVFRKIMNISLVDTQDIGPARHISGATFLGGQAEFDAFMTNDKEAFASALRQHSPGDLIQQAYSFPTKFQHRTTDPWPKLIELTLV